MDVAIYLRKSRDEADNVDVLSKHRDTLIAIANSNKWKYTLYEEVASGERIAYRPVMQRLLEDVENGKYDAILVMDIDRLGRGNNKDWGAIYEAFCNESFNTLIVTPQRSYDLREDTDEMMVDIQSLFAKMEYKAIKRRMLRGKVAGAKQGKWVCGNPPYPYINGKDGLEVDEEKSKIYRMMIDMACRGISLQKISIYMNKQKIRTPSGAIPGSGILGWDYTVIRRIITDETHLGYIIYGKTKGNHRKGNWSRIPKEQWVRVKGNHTPLKTQEEHDKILSNILDRRSVPVAARSGKYELSGLLFCKKCGHAMRFTMTRGRYKCAQCRFRFPDGTVCNQRGTTLADPFIPNIFASIVEIDESEIMKLRELNNKQKEISDAISRNEKEIEKIDIALSRLFELYEDGEIDRDTFTKRRAIREKHKQELHATILQLTSSIVPVEDENEFLEKLRTIKREWYKSATPQEKNELLHTIVEKIVYDRNGDDPPILEIYYK